MTAHQLAAAGDGVAVLHAEWFDGTVRGRYHERHLRGAIAVDTDALEDGRPTWKLRPLRDLTAAFGRLGLDGAQPIVVMGESLVAAARVAWVLHYCGAASVALVEGGFEELVSAGLPITTAVPAARAPVVFANSRRGRTSLFTTSAVEQALQSGDTCLVDVRTTAEFAGETSGYDYLERAGRIPTARHVPLDGWQSALTAGDWPAVEEAFASALPNRAQRAVFYCGSGWRSALAWWVARSLGYRNVFNYSDGWCGWSTRYVRDDASGGWRQEASGRPCLIGDQTRASS